MRGEQPSIAVIFSVYNEELTIRQSAAFLACAAGMLVVTLAAFALARASLEHRLRTQSQLPLPTMPSGQRSCALLSGNAR